MEHAFGRGESLALGVEEELLLVDPETLALARDALRERGGDGALEEAERILREGNGADRMRAAHEQGGMRAVLERLVAEAQAG